MDDSKVRVSIIMPAHDAADSIGRAISSALRQTEQNLELIVVDDASIDSTVATVSQLAAQDHRVRLLRQAVNQGPAAARNVGLANAHGKWIALLDADDEYVPERIEQLIALGEQYGADVVSDNLLLCSKEGAHAATPMIPPATIPTARWMSAAEFVAGNIGSRYTPRVSYGFMKPVIRRSFLEAHGLRYEERNRFGEDFLLSLACLLDGARWWMTPEPMYRYTVRSGSATEIQSAADLLRIRKWEEELLRGHPMVAADPVLAGALRRHKAVIEHFYYYRAFTDALKARSVCPALHVLLESPSSFRHIMTESALQAPRVTMKALRGGFRSEPRRIPATGRSATPRHTGRQA